jgi:hypothetical protein
MVSLKSWVSAITESPVSSFVCTRRSIPAPPRCPSLPFLGTAANQNHKAVAIFTEVDAVAGTEIDLAFEDAGTNALYLREIPQFHPRKRDRHPGGCCRVDPFEPLGEALVSLLVNVAAEFDHPELMVTIVLPLVNARARCSTRAEERASAPFRRWQ